MGVALKNPAIDLNTRERGEEMGKCKGCKYLYCHGPYAIFGTIVDCLFPIKWLRFIGCLIHYYSRVQSSGGSNG